MSRHSFIGMMILFILFSVVARGQTFHGFAHSNYAGVHGLLIQPASIVDSRYQVDINLASFNFTFLNNYIGLKRDYIKASDRSVSGFDEFKARFLNERINDDSKFVYVALEFLGPSFMFPINEDNSLAFASRFRTRVHMDGISTELAKLSWEELNYPQLWNVDLDNEDFSIQAMSWAEYGVTYGRKIFMIGNHYLKGAMTAKLLQGLGSAFMFVNDLSYNFRNDDTLSLFQSEVSYGHSSNFEFETDQVRYRYISKPSFGFDLGFVYEWRPNKEKYRYDMDGQTALPRRDKEKYKLKVGFSLMDIGRLKFGKGDQSADFTADISLYDIQNFSVGSVQEWNDSIAKLFGFNPDDAKDYKLNLPTTIGLQFDYNIWGDFYVDFTSQVGFKRRKDPSKVRESTIIGIAPRYDYKWFGFGIPFSINFDEGKNMGLYLRMGPLVLGTLDLLTYASKDEIYGANFYMALKIPVPFRMPKDKDKDLVSNKRDHCKNLPGVWEFKGCPDTDADGLPDDKDRCPLKAGPVENNGCPYTDRDGDTVMDTIDACPDVPGPVANDGCPYGDKDEDGVLDNEDECIDVPGPVENKGCPYGDKDEDGVLDNADNCIDVPGPAENNGCPFGDNDGDGVLDNADNCIDVPGPAENNGCPFGDKDGDGVLDNSDNCIDVPGPPENNGCPFSDRDQDGIPDKDDDCIDAAGPPENNGCPYLDTDGDGLLDKDDECPKTPGPVENNGCPELEEEEEEIIQTAFENLEFESGKSIIKVTSYKTLEELGGLLERKPEAKLRIAGHTDNVGSDAINLKLSRLRAEAVKRFLVERGVAASQFIVEYYGEQKPIADNATPAGRQKNRRVEMEIVFE